MESTSGENAAASIKLKQKRKADFDLTKMYTQEEEVTASGVVKRSRRDCPYLG